MIANFNFKVSAGPRTPIEVDCIATSVNEKTFKFSNGKTITDKEIAKWVQKELEKALKQYADEK